MEEIMGTIKLFAGNFAPKGYLYCNGALLPIQQYSALYSILGTVYGGDGVSSFALPDLRSRVPVGGGMGASPTTQTTVVLGELAGETNHTLLSSEIPSHNHQLAVSNVNASISTPINGATIATPGSLSGRDFVSTLGYNQEVPNTTLATSSVMPNGGGGPHNNMQPYLGLSYIICVEGVYPSRP